MFPEQAIIKAKDVEVPLIAFDHPLVWVGMLMVFILGCYWIKRRFREDKSNDIKMHGVGSNSSRVGLLGDIIEPQADANQKMKDYLSQVEAQLPTNITKDYLERLHAYPLNTQQR